MSDAEAPLKHGDFSRLADDYARYRPSYAPSVRDAVIAIVRQRVTWPIVAIDVGAGTGIWTRLLASAGCRTVAVEPDDAMRRRGEEANDGLPIEWRRGSAEDTGLPSASCDLVSMASSLHWADFDRATAEFARLLRARGSFLALWNTRAPEANPLLARIEAKLRQVVPDLKRVSSGRSEFCETLTERLLARGLFEDVLYLEGRHVERQSPERYIGLWRSVNDVRVQAGPERFEQFMRYVSDEVSGRSHIEATYVTRAWLAFTRRG
jgi:SAM-dependent methyltransferase